MANITRQISNMYIHQNHVLWTSQSFVIHNIPEHEGNFIYLYKDTMQISNYKHDGYLF